MRILITLAAFASFDLGIFACALTLAQREAQPGLVVIACLALVMSVACQVIWFWPEGSH